MKRILICLLALLMLSVAVTSCQKGNYTDSADVNALADTAISVLNPEIKYLTPDEFYLVDYFDTPTYVKSYTLRRAMIGNNLNEIGIYHVEEGKAEEMKNVLENYLDTCYNTNKTWYESYIPQEVPKLRDAQVKVFGNYVVYVILNQEDRAAVLNAIESALQ
jgi:DNA phosphorothioation-dependent restriction protein DptG